MSRSGLPTNLRGLAQTRGRPEARALARQLRRPPEIGEVTADVEIAGRHLFPQFGQDAGFPGARPAGPGLFQRLPSSLFAPQPGADPRRRLDVSLPGRDVDRDQAVGAPDLLPVEDLHQVPVALRVLHQKDEPLPAISSSQPKRGLNPAPAAARFHFPQP